MKTQQKGFSAIEVLIVLIIFGLIGGIGWYVWQMQQDKSDVSHHSQSTDQIKTSPTNDNLERPTSYTFDKLGVTMDILSGWKVTTDNTGRDYVWHVRKADADSSITLAAYDFGYGFDSCTDGGTLLPVTIYDVAPTQRPNLLLMAWSSPDPTNSDKISNNIDLVRADMSSFRMSKDVSAKPTKNNTIKPGTYYRCDIEPAPGFNLHTGKYQNSEGRYLVDSINAEQTDTSYRGLPTGLHSYGDIKTMLTSIR